MSLLALSGTSPLSREGRRSSNGMFQYRRGTTTPLTTPHPSWGKTSLAFLPLVHSSSTHGCGLSLQTDGHLFFSPFCIEAQESLPAHSPLHPPLILVGEVTPTPLSRSQSIIQGKEGRNTHLCLFGTAPRCGKSVYVLDQVRTTGMLSRPTAHTWRKGRGAALCQNIVIKIKTFSAGGP